LAVFILHWNCTTAKTTIATITATYALFHLVLGSVGKSRLPGTLDAFHIAGMERLPATASPFFVG
jgi:hypothetical protein